MVTKIIKYSCSAVCTIAMFIMATLFHKIEDVELIDTINNTTQVMQVPTGKAFTFYGIFLVIAIIGTILASYKSGDLIGALVSWGLTVTRFIAALAMISGGVAIFVFGSKLLAVLQIVVVLAMFGIQTAVGKRR